MKLVILTPSLASIVLLAQGLGRLMMATYLRAMYILPTPTLGVPVHTV